MEPKLNYCTFQIVNHKSADQTVQMRRLIYTFVVHLQQSPIFLRQGPNYIYACSDLLLTLKAPRKNASENVVC